MLIVKLEPFMLTALIACIYDANELKSVDMLSPNVITGDFSKLSVQMTSGFASLFQPMLAI